MNKYSIKYFINKFEAIPEDKWCVFSRYDGWGRMCALGHTCEDRGRRFTKESDDLASIFGSRLEVARINNGTAPQSKFLGDTPKQRVLNALYTKLREGAAIK